MSTCKERMIKAGEMYEEVVKDNEKLSELLNFLKCINKNMSPLSKYYFNEWLEDREELSEEDFRNAAMSEDLIYNEITTQYELMKKILLVSAEYINRDFDYEE